LGGCPGSKLSEEASLRRVSKWNQLLTYVNKYLFSIQVDCGEGKILSSVQATGPIPKDNSGTGIGFAYKGKNDAE
jgi:hypothetical protein